MPVKIRSETPADYQEISRVNDLAFERPNERRLVENLRMNPRFIPELSLVAELREKIAGHILFFPVKIKTAAGQEKETISLAPVAVLPQFQKQGIGSELIKEGIQICRKNGYNSVIVLGHPEYYPKFGFKQAETRAIKDPFGAPVEAFMALELNKGVLHGAEGIVEYPDEFFEV